MAANRSSVVLGLVGVSTSSFPPSLETSAVSEDRPAVLGSGNPASPPCGDAQLFSFLSPSTRFSPDSSCAGPGDVLGWTMGALASTTPGDKDPAAPLSRTVLPEVGAVAGEPAPDAGLDFSSWLCPASPSAPVGLGTPEKASLPFSVGSAVKSLCGGGTTRNSLGFLEMGGGFLLGEESGSRVVLRLGPGPGAPSLQL